MTIKVAKLIIKTSASKIVIGNTSFLAVTWSRDKKRKNGATALPAYVAKLIISHRPHQKHMFLYNFFIVSKDNI
ncbi:hypothetical protein B5V89_18775 [Heyndrickxia sporothermodurans]|nr:hypothetical protein B5V89_18775 [Heyndrickxia sporothermodurans]